MGSESLRVNRDCIFLPSPSPTCSGDFGAGLSMAGVKGRRKASSRKPARLCPCHPTPSRFEAEQRKKKENRLSLQAELWCNSSWKSRGKAWASRELGVILISCLTNLADASAARPCPHCGGRQLPLFHFHGVMEEWLCAGMKPRRSNQTTGGGWGACLGIFGCNKLRIRECKEYSPPPPKCSNLSPVSISILSALSSTWTYRTRFTFVTR